jgi:hypothetical protein
MVNISVFSNTCFTIENIEYNLDSQEKAIQFLLDLLNKIHYSGEKICLEKATIIENENNGPSVTYTFIDEWP